MTRKTAVIGAGEQMYKSTELTRPPAYPLTKNTQHATRNTQHAIKQTVFFVNRAYILLVVLFLSVAGCKASHEGEEAVVEEKIEVVKVSIQPKYSLSIMSKNYSPIIRYLSAETGYKIRLVSALSYNSYFYTLEANQVDIAFQNPLAYVILHKTRGAYPLVKTVEFYGGDKYRGMIITHQESGIEKIKELQGKKVAVASRRALGGYLGQALLCQENGIDEVEKELSIVLMRTQDDVIFSVYRQKVDAGFVREDALQEVRGRIDLGKIKFVEYTDYFPTWCVTAFRNTRPEVAEKIKNALLKLDVKIPQQKDILEAMGATSFIEANDLDYKVVREMMDKLDIPY
ncbi:phosphate/phosphite/phosphonate ABC transporter substrate-binding protein [Candidatus Poribacteria bacterium]|nr:phosphate/phosphite/phosphonate ABC transporter substrate-binding protein [Candidatus Poribacteria bacterium]